jgi:hypothetical protein
MQICDLDYYTPTQMNIIGGASLVAIASVGTIATSVGPFTLTKVRSLTQTNISLYRATSLSSGTAISIASPYKYTSGILASGRATVSSLGSAQS